MSAAEWEVAIRPRGRRPELCLWPVVIDKQEHLARLLSRTVRAESGCLRWTRAHDKNGYGVFSIKARKVLAHRASYLLQVGPIPDGLVLDHVAARGCVYRDCIEPAHLEAVTQRENLRRARPVREFDITDLDVTETCVRGHKRIKANTYTYQRDGKSQRTCRPCNAQIAEKSKARRRARRAEQSA